MAGLNRPEKKVTYKEKVRNDYEYCKTWIKWCISASRWYHITPEIQVPYGETHAGVLYDIANGKIPHWWFNSVTNRFNYGENRELPAKIDDFNLVYPSLQYLEGKKMERPFNYQVENMSSESSTIKQEEINKQIRNELLKVWEGEPDAAQQGMELEQKIEQFILSYKDNKALRGQDILDYVIQEQDIKEKLIECFRHWLIIGETIMFMDVKDDKIIAQPISPLYVAHSKIAYDFKNRYYQDQEWICVRYYWTAGEVLDYFKEDFTDKELELLEQAPSVRSRFAYMFGSEYMEERYNSYLDNIECIHCQWTVFKKVGKLTYTNPLTGEEEIEEVGEEFKLGYLKELGYKLEWHWETEKWEGWQIGGKHYKRIRPLPVQNGKLNYYGRRYSNLHSANTSVVKMALPYVKLYCVLWYKLEVCIAKSKGQIAIMPIEALTGGEGKEEWTYKEALYTSDSLGVLLYSISNPALQGQTLNNMLGNVKISQAEEAQWLMQMLEIVRKGWLDMIGITPTALAQASSDKGLGVTQTEIYQSSVITEPIFTHFEYFEEKLLQSILDYTQYAYIEGKNMTVIRDDNSVSYLEIDGIDHLNSEYGVFVVKSSDEARRLEQVRQLAMELSSQGQDPSKLVEMVYAKNSSKLKQILYDLKNKEIEQAQQQSKTEEELKQQTIQIQQAYKQFEAELEVEKAAGIAAAEFPYKKELELIKLEANQLSFQNTMDSDMNGIPDVNEVEKRSNERLKMNIDSSLKIAELKLKNKEIDSKERTEKLKAKIAIKNKVVGEK